MNPADAAFCSRCGLPRAASPQPPAPRPPAGATPSWLGPAIALGVFGALGLAVVLAAFVGLSRSGRPGGGLPPPGATSAAPAEGVSFAADSVVLNYQTRQMEISGVVHYDGPTPPRTMWVWAYFFVLDSSYGGGSWSDEPIEVQLPADGRNDMRITASGPFHWALNDATPRSGYFARVSVSTSSPDAARVPTAARLKYPSGAIAVRSVP